MSVILGIDPGQEGALALLDSYGEWIDMRDMPCVGNAVSPKLFMAALGELVGGQTCTVVVEQVHSMPKQGVASAFKFGMAYGIVLGAVSATYGLRVEHVTPQRWKKDMRLSSDKEQSRKRALDRWPSRSEWIKFKKNADRAEAALLALWWHERLERGAA